MTSLEKLIKKYTRKKSLNKTIQEIIDQYTLQMSAKGELRMNRLTRKKWN